MAISYPTSLDSFSNPSSTDTMDSGATPHATQHANANDALEALEAKLGIGASTPVANSVLAGSATGVSGWSTGPRLENLGIGAAVSTARGLLIDGTVTSAGTTQYGAEVSPALTSAATTAGAALYAQLVTAAASFTMVSGNGVLVDVPSLGAASAVTTQYGVRVLNQGASGVTNAYGVHIAAQSGAATTNIGLFNAGTTQLSGVVGAGIAPSTDRALYVYANALTGTFQYGVAALPDFASAATSGGTAGYFRGGTAAAAFTASVVAAVQAANPNKGAGSTITTAHGLLVDAQTQGGTNNYGVFVNTPSGGSGNNIGGYFAGGAPAIYVAAGGITVIGSGVGVGVAAVSNALTLSNAIGSLTGTADMVKLGAYDLSAGNATLSLATETAVAVDVVAASTHTLSVRINGTTYKILLST